MNLKLQLMPDGQTWGVYVKPDDNITISTGQTITIGGNTIILVMPIDLSISDFENVNGIWLIDADIIGPTLNPNKKYLMVGLQAEVTPIPYMAGQETLLFKFKTGGECPSSINIIDSVTDPLALQGTDCGGLSNEFAVFDMVTLAVFSFKGTYAPAAWDCHDNDGDGILNALEDTNGNGVYDPGVDVTDLNNPDFVANNTGALKFKLQLLPDGQTMGVFVKPDENINISTGQTITIGGNQITLVMPKDFPITDLKNINGNWSVNSVTNGPSENPTKSYLSWGFQSEAPPIPYVPGQETLLFTFKTGGDCPSSIQLIDNATDPFNQLPNSEGNNPGNHFEVFDFITDKAFSFEGSYAPAAWDCHDNDNDGIPNALEDTNGNGVFDLGVDASDLNGNGVANAAADIRLKLQLMPDGQTWNVYVKPDDAVSMSEQTITGQAQVTVVMPKDYEWTGLQSVSGTWVTNATVNGAQFSPSKKYVSFGLTSDYPHINYVTGSETLLFSLKMQNDCPAGIYLIDNETDPLMLNNDVMSPATEFAIFDPINPNLYSVTSTYAPAAWDCHDNDSDGIANALEDTNGNGIFDAGVDASDLNSAPQLGTGCVLLKLQMLPDSTGWGVFAKPSNGYLPSANAVATGGQVTIVAPESFDFTGLESAVGQWTLTSTLHAQPNNPSRKYLTIQLAPSSTTLNLTAGGTMLFKFDKLGNCPDSLYILENNIPASLTANEFNGTDLNSFTSSGFEYCGVYARKNWRCKPSAPQGPVIFVGTDSLAAPQTGAADRGTEAGNLAKGESFTLAPNPAGDFVSILVSPDLAEGRKTLALWDLQGKKHQEIILENTATKLDLNGLPAGVYFVSLAQNGRVVERKKLVKN